LARKLLLAATTTGYQTREFAAAAERAGVELVFATDRCKGMDDPWGDHALWVRFQDPAGSARRILPELGDIAGVLAVGDRPAPLAAEVAIRLGLPFHPPSAVAAARNKFSAREHFRAAGLAVPEYFRVPTGEGPEPALERAQWPCVLKPLGLSGSRGVIRASTPAEFRAAFARIAALLEAPEIRRLRDDADTYIQVESYIPGREYALEGLMTGGRLTTLALFDKPDPLEGPFFEETIYVTPSRAPEAAQQAIVEAVTRAVAALGLTDGPVHAEARLNERGAWVLEVAARPIGGLCSRALRFAGGWTLEDVLLRQALGETPSPLEPATPASGVMMIPIPKSGVFESVAGVEEARRVPLIEDVVITAKQGQALLMLPEGYSYLGFIFARGGQPAAVESALRAAHAALHFEIATRLPVLRPTPSTSAAQSSAEAAPPHRRNTAPSA
jgi:biotin carboxylase